MVSSIKIKYFSIPFLNINEIIKRKKIDKTITSSYFISPNFFSFSLIILLLIFDDDDISYEKLVR